MDAGDEYYNNKSCTECEGGKAVITSSDEGYIAGVYYAANLYECVSCPDSEMSFSGSAGSLACSCSSE